MMPRPLQRRQRVHDEQVRLARLQRGRRHLPARLLELLQRTREGLWIAGQERARLVGLVLARPRDRHLDQPGCDRGEDPGHQQHDGVPTMSSPPNQKAIVAR